MLWLWLTSPDILYKTELFKLNWIMLHNDLFIPKWKVSVQIQKVFDPISRKIALCNKWYFMMIYYYFPTTARPWDSRFLVPKKWKNGPQKLLIISPDPFISQSSPDHSPLPRIDFSYYEISGSNICFLICGRASVLDLSISVNYYCFDVSFWLSAAIPVHKSYQHARLSSLYMKGLFWAYMP